MATEDETKLIRTYLALRDFFLTYPIVDWGSLSPAQQNRFRNCLYCTTPLPKPAKAEEPKPEEPKEHEVFWLAPIKVWETFFLLLAAIAAAYYIRGK